MEIDAKITYFNGTIYKEIVQPFNLTIGPDNNNSFENAEEIGFGQHEAYIDDGADPVDYYRIWLQQGQRVQIAVALPGWGEIPPPGDLDMHVYKPNRQVALSLLDGINTTGAVVNADLTGWWYIQVDCRVLLIYILMLSER